MRDIGGGWGKSLGSNLCDIIYENSLTYYLIFLKLALHSLWKHLFSSLHWNLKKNVLYVKASLEWWMIILGTINRLARFMVFKLLFNNVLDSPNLRRIDPVQFASEYLSFLVLAINLTFQLLPFVLLGKWKKGLNK